MLSRGYMQFGAFRGVPLRLHWTILPSLFVFGSRGPWVWLGITALIMLHEAGHAFFVRRYGLRVKSVDLHGLGGETRWVGNASARQRVVIAWGGVMMQASALAVVWGALSVFGEPSATWLADIAYAYTTVNLWMIGLNLLPIPGFDGWTAWQILPFFRPEQRHTKATRRPRLHIVQSHVPVERDVQLQVMSDIEREIAAMADEHNSAHAGTSTSGDTEPE